MIYKLYAVEEFANIYSQFFHWSPIVKFVNFADINLRVLDKRKDEILSEVSYRSRRDVSRLINNLLKSSDRIYKVLSGMDQFFIDRLIDYFEASTSKFKPQVNGEVVPERTLSTFDFRFITKYFPVLAVRAYPLSNDAVVLFGEPVPFGFVLVMDNHPLSLGETVRRLLRRFSSFSDEDMSITIGGRKYVFPNITGYIAGLYHSGHPDHGVELLKNIVYQQVPEGMVVSTDKTVFGWIVTVTGNATRLGIGIPTGSRDLIISDRISFKHGDFSKVRHTFELIDPSTMTVLSSYYTSSSIRDIGKTIIDMLLHTDGFVVDYGRVFGSVIEFAERNGYRVKPWGYDVKITSDLKDKVNIDKTFIPRFRFEKEISNDVELHTTIEIIDQTYVASINIKRRLGYRVIGARFIENMFKATDLSDYLYLVTPSLDGGVDIILTGKFSSLDEIETFTRKALSYVDNIIETFDKGYRVSVLRKEKPPIDVSISYAILKYWGEMKIDSTTLTGKSEEEVLGRIREYVKCTECSVDDLLKKLVEKDYASIDEDGDIKVVGEYGGFIKVKSVMEPLGVNRDDLNSHEERATWRVVDHIISAKGASNFISSITPSPKILSLLIEHGYSSEVRPEHLSYNVEHGIGTVWSNLPERAKEKYLKEGRIDDLYRMAINPLLFDKTDVIVKYLLKRDRNLGTKLLYEKYPSSIVPPVNSLVEQREITGIRVGDFLIQVVDIDGLSPDSTKTFLVFSDKDKIGYPVRDTSVDSLMSRINKIHESFIEEFTNLMRMERDGVIKLEHTRIGDYVIYRVVTGRGKHSKIVKPGITRRIPITSRYTDNNVHDDVSS